MIFSTKQLHLLILCTFPGFGEMGFGEMGVNCWVRDEIIMKQLTIDVWWSASNAIINVHWQCLWLLVLASWTQPKQVFLLPVVNCRQK